MKTDEEWIASEGAAAEAEGEARAQEEQRMRISVRVKKNPVHAHLSIWVNGALISAPMGICLRVEELEEFLVRLQPDAILDEAAVKPATEDRG